MIVSCNILCFYLGNPPPPPGRKSMFHVLIVCYADCILQYTLFLLVQFPPPPPKFNLNKWWLFECFSADHVRFLDTNMREKGHINLVVEWRQRSWDCFSRAVGFKLVGGMLSLIVWFSASWRSIWNSILCYSQSELFRETEEVERRAWPRSWKKARYIFLALPLIISNTS